MIPPDLPDNRVAIDQLTQIAEALERVAERLDRKPAGSKPTSPPDNTATHGMASPGPWVRGEVLTCGQPSQVNIPIYASDGRGRVAEAIGGTVEEATGNAALIILARELLDFVRKFKSTEHLYCASDWPCMYERARELLEMVDGPGSQVEPAESSFEIDPDEAWHASEPRRVYATLEAGETEVPMWRVLIRRADGRAICEVACETKMEAVGVAELIAMAPTMLHEYHRSLTSEPMPHGPEAASHGTAGLRPAAAPESEPAGP